MLAHDKNKLTKFLILEIMIRQFIIGLKMRWGEMLHFHYLLQPYLFSHAPFIQQETPNSLSIGRTFCLMLRLMLATTQIAYFTNYFACWV